MASACPCEPEYGGVYNDQSAGWDRIPRWWRSCGKHWELAIVAVLTRNMASEAEEHLQNLVKLKGEECLGSAHKKS